MRLLHLTDTHLGIKRHFRGAPGGWSRSDDHMDAFRAALAFARDPTLAGKVDVVIHSGDLFDRSHPPQGAVDAAIEAFTALAREIPVLLMPGNHDRLGLLHHADGALGRIPGLTVTDRPLSVDVGDVRIGLVPFCREPAEWAASAGTVGESDLLVAHQAFHGARVGNFQFGAGVDPETISVKDLPPGTRTILCGHIHPRQSHTIGPATVYYTGSTERTAFSERRETKGCALVEFDRNIRYRWLDLESRPMLEVHSEHDADRVQHGTLVRLAGHAKSKDVQERVIERGGWVVPWKEEERQIGLFR